MCMCKISKTKADTIPTCESDDAVWHLSCTSGLSSWTERPRNTKIGTEVAHVRRDLDTTFKVKSLSSPGRFTHRRVNASGSCSDERGNVLAVGNYC